ncbi:MAG: energy transducer TonB [Prevotellaceae bacterium]|jgi:protein TonB|nr:energy transducer TonB [Prevotellaceae bacterium]
MKTNITSIKISLFVFAFSLFVFKTSAQETTNTADTVAINENAEETLPIDSIKIKPKFKGKDPKTHFRKWVNSQIKYPEQALMNGIEGMVVVKITIDKTGTVSNVVVVKAAAHILNEETVRVIYLSPKWTPGYINGEPVNVTYTFAMNFSLTNDYPKKSGNNNRNPYNLLPNRNNRFP